MKPRDHTRLLRDLAEEYSQHAPKSAALNEIALMYLADGGSHTKRLIYPFPPRIVAANGAWVVDEDTHKILDLWQGHYANILGHNPPIVTDTLKDVFSDGYGLQTGFTDRLQVETAEIICKQTGSERIRFTTSGTLATMYAILLARAYTKREKVMKVGGGWHGGHLWALKGVGFQDRAGFDLVDSVGLPGAITEDVHVTLYNHPDILQDHFKQFGDELACFILEPIMGAGGLMPASKEYVQTARKLTEQYGVVLIFDEVISGFRFRAGDVGRLYGVKPDLITLGKIIGGGMPLAAVAGRGDILDLVGRAGGRKVKFTGGTFSGHPATLLAAKTMLTHLVENENEVYPKLAEISRKTRRAVLKVFEEEGILARFAGEQIQDIPDCSLHMLVFPYDTGHALISPDEVKNPEICDVVLCENVVQLAMLLENVHVMHGLGSTCTAHTEEDIQFLSEAFQRVARRIKPYI
ncbi:MAG: aminotransferase class III-fold pyridoxal phosphate-dependent enzyme [Anaerolineales bacterium]|jgi:glutamate-1-semialdehyde 2,1-aminomutase